MVLNPNRKGRDRLLLTSVGLCPFLEFGGEHFLQPQVVLPRVVDAARQPHPKVARVATSDGVEFNAGLLGLMMIYE